MGTFLASAVLHPLFRRFVASPNIKTHYIPDGWEVPVVEDFVLLVQNATSFSVVILLRACCHLELVVVHECLLSHYFLMLLDEGGMAGWQTFHLFEIVAMGGLVDPRVNDLDLHVLRTGLVFLVFCALLEGFKIWVILAGEGVM